MNKPTDLVAAVAELTLALHAIRTAQISPAPRRTAVAVMFIRAAVAQMDHRGALAPAPIAIAISGQPHGAERDWLANIADGEGRAG